MQERKKRGQGKCANRLSLTLQPSYRLSTCYCDTGQVVFVRTPFCVFAHLLVTLTPFIFCVRVVIDFRHLFDRFLLTLVFIWFLPTFDNNPFRWFFHLHFHNPIPSTVLAFCVCLFVCVVFRLFLGSYHTSNTIFKVSQGRGTTPLPIPTTFHLVL